MSSLPVQPGRYELLSSTRYDSLLSRLKWNNDRDGPCFLFLPHYHLDRLIDAAHQHGWDQAKASLTYDTLKSSCHRALEDYNDQRDTSQAFKIRLSLSESGELTASATPTTSFLSDPTSASFFNPLSDNASLFGSVRAIYVDSKPTPASLFTSTKTTHRTMYNDARLRARLPLTLDPSNLTDVLMYNSEDYITETSIFNVAFYRSPYWITPSASTGCLPGVLRRWLLEQGRIHEDKDNQLSKDSIKQGDWVLLFNGVQGCRLGRIVDAP
ncbi:aminotransferase [Lyophyllum atratum]|nr:aminotransferase [Lyophyllum atratum]